MAANEITVTLRVRGLWRLRLFVFAVRCAVWLGIPVDGKRAWAVARRMIKIDFT
jgi:hypothetical protein